MTTRLHHYEGRLLVLNYVLNDIIDEKKIYQTISIINEFSV